MNRKTFLADLVDIRMQFTLSNVYNNSIYIRVIHTYVHRNPYIVLTSFKHQTDRHHRDLVTPIEINYTVVYLRYISQLIKRDLSKRH